MPVTPYSQVAFRCKKCGRFHTSDDAGDWPHPPSCRVCDGGMIYTTEPEKELKRLKEANPKHDFRSHVFAGPVHRVVDASNWECLADASEERLAELGIKRDDVATHTQHAFPDAGKVVSVTAGDGAGTQDKVGGVANA